MPRPLSYAHFEVKVGSDGFPVELGAGAMAITYGVRDMILHSIVALKVIDRQMAETLPRGRDSYVRRVPPLNCIILTSRGSLITASKTVNASTPWTSLRERHSKNGAPRGSNCPYAL